ncbi:hypothetical protein J5N97_028941 [Dioscorea zingiberensis]|uniref:Uncharacterized protein n=1 Tax=Dioscorea zingiberensis TaxID=325984 RepID=A0A9D5C0K4_9LILI|nr:hypothetical protein J5N97_028941 [Dioscorea zingiberensis]
MVEEVKEEGKGEKVQGVWMAACSPASDESFEMEARAVPGKTAGPTGPTRRSTKGGWTDEEDAILAKAVRQFNGKNWKKIAEYVPDRSDVQCLHRWQKVIDPDLVKGAWTKEEDDRIIKLVEKYGPKKWSLIAQSMPGRIGKQCRERWHNHLNPAIKKDAWTKEEEIILIHAHQVYGNKWAEIAKLLPGRADNSIKNHWNCSLKKRLDSILDSGILGQTPGLSAFDLNYHSVRSGSQPVDPTKQKIKSLDQKRTAVKSSFTPEVCLGDQDLSLGFQDFGFHPVIKNFGSLRPEDKKVTLEDSKRLKVELKSIPLEDPKCVSVEVRDFMKPLLHWEDNSPANYPTSRLYKDASPWSTDLLHRVTNLCRIEDSDQTDASDDSHGASVLQPKAYNSIGNQFSSQSPCDRFFSNKILESPKNLRNHEFALKDENKKFKDTNVSGTPSTVFSSRDNFFGSDQIIRTLQPSEDSTSYHLYHEPLQLAGNEVSLVNSQKSNMDVHIKQKHNQVHSSTPPSLSLSLACVPSSPESILRSAAKSFKNIPSIMRKRGRESSKVLFAENPQRASCATIKHDGGGAPFVKAVDIENIKFSECASHNYQRKDRFDLNNPDILNKEHLLPCPSGRPLKNSQVLKTSVNSRTHSFVDNLFKVFLLACSLFGVQKSYAAWFLRILSEKCSKHSRRVQIQMNIGANEPTKLHKIYSSRSTFGKYLYQVHIRNTIFIV